MHLNTDFYFYLSLGYYQQEVFLVILGITQDVLLKYGFSTHP